MLLENVCELLSEACILYFVFFDLIPFSIGSLSGKQLIYIHSKLKAKGYYDLQFKNLF